MRKTRKALTDDEVASKLRHIFGAAGGVEFNNQVAEAILAIFDRTGNAEQVVRTALEGFDRKRVTRTNKFKFPAAWPKIKWMMVSSTCIEEFRGHAQSIIEESNGDISLATKMVTGALKHLDDDERIAFLMVVLTHLCPFDFYVGREKFGNAELGNLSKSNPNFRKLFGAISGKGDKRFPTNIDQADYVVTLTTGMGSRRELVAFVTSLIQWAKRAGVEEANKAMERELAGMMKSLNLMLGMGHPMAHFLRHEGGSALGFTNPVEAAMRDLMFLGRLTNPSHDGHNGSPREITELFDRLGRRGVTMTQPFGNGPVAFHGPDCHCDPAVGGVGCGCDHAAGSCRPHHPDRPEDERGGAC